MRKFYDGELILSDVSQAIEGALAKHGIDVWSLLGVTTVFAAIGSPLKVQVQGIAGSRLGTLGLKAYAASTIPRRVALLQSPGSQTVNPMMEGIVVALQKAGEPLIEDRLRLAAYRVFLWKPRASLRSAEKQNSSIAPGFSSARDYLEEGRIIDRGEIGAWRLNDLWELT